MTNQIEMVSPYTYIVKGWLYFSCNSTVC